MARYIVLWNCFLFDSSTYLKAYLYTNVDIYEHKIIRKNTQLKKTKSSSLRQHEIPHNIELVFHRLSADWGGLNSGMYAYVMCCAVLM